MRRYKIKNHRVKHLIKMEIKKSQIRGDWRRITRANTLDNAINKGKVFIDIFKK